MESKEIADLLKLVGQFRRLSLKTKHFELEIEREADTTVITAPSLPHHSQPHSPLVQEKKEAIPAVELLLSPMVGTFYSSRMPSDPPFVQVGVSVKKGDTLCIIEAMKVMNEVKAQCDGRVKEIYCKNGEGVEYKQPLFRIEP